MSPKSPDIDHLLTPMNPLPGELHLTPLHKTLQLRPSMHYLDAKDAAEREEAKREKQGEDDELLDSDDEKKGKKEIGKDLSVSCVRCGGCITQDGTNRGLTLSCYWYRSPFEQIPMRCQGHSGLAQRTR